ncbi:MAG: histidine kinase dimerization/phospho-acceptor domain-containing protein, partial [Bacteroidota bacterium]
MEQSQLRERMAVFARTLEEDRDEFAEYLLNELILQIRHDAFINMAAESPLSDKSRILQKLYQYHLGGYLAKFPKQAGFYGSDGLRVEGNTLSSLAELKAGVNPINDTDSSGGVFLRSKMSTADGLGKSYLVLVSAGPGTIAVVVDMRTSAVDRPWYFRLDDREFENEIGDGLSYRIFSENQVVFQSGGAAYKYFNEGELSERMSLFNQDELTVRMSDARKLIIAGPDYSFGRLLTNFSFYVFIAFVLLATVRLVQMLLHRMSGQILSYTGRIQLYLAMAFVLPMVITSIAAIRNVSLEDEGQITDQHRKKVLALATEVGRQSVAGIAPSRDQLVNTGILSDDGYILYDLNGRRLFSNEPELLESSLMPQFMNPIALERMRQGLPYTAIREEVAGYDYQGTYTVIKAGIPAVPVAWLHVPNFDYYASAERARIGVIMSILPIAVLVFTVFLLVSYQLSARLTHPIRDISRALRKGSLSGIKFQREGTNSDEIGKLMEAYDQMMTGLEKSKNELLANQRDADWRNMARQVAHEIRNPLTPIRLKLQWLQRQLKEGVHDPKQASASIDTILAQTDI